MFDKFRKPGHLNSEPTTSLPDNSVFFAPEQARKERVSLDEVNDFQNNYIGEISKKNMKHSSSFATLPYEDTSQESEFRQIFDDTSFSPHNVAKGFVTFIMVIVLVLCVYVPFGSPDVMLALAQSGNGGFSSIETFGSGEQEAKRENPSYAANVSLTVRGKSETFNTTESTVWQVLKEKGITVDYGEDVYPNPEAKVGDNEVIIVDQVVSRTVTTPEEIAFDEERVDDITLRKGQESIVQEGQNGEVNNTYIVREVGGQLVSRVLFSSVQLVPVQKKVIRVGTAELPDNGSSITIPTDEVKKFALDQVLARGWSEGEFGCLDKLWQKESGWRPHAGNIFSGAYGIPQALPGSKMSTFGDDWRDNPMTQIKWGINYIANRYGTPCVAWGNSQAKGWY